MTKIMMIAAMFGSIVTGVAVGAGTASADDNCTNQGEPVPCLPAGSVHSQWGPLTDEDQEAAARRARMCTLWLTEPPTCDSLTKQPPPR
ncbi:hypothetical protein [Nocardia tengchongensis]|uniref:hypothetical protein n=1 Tax=Nocardia tengchongensis TaxID=2055889 RepID=UPI00365A1085